MQKREIVQKTFFFCNNWNKNDLHKHLCQYSSTRVVKQRKDSLFGDALGLLDAICRMRPPWQLRATRREMMAVLPKPTLPTMMDPELSPDSLGLRSSSSCWNSQSRPTNTESVVMLGTSNSSGLSMMSEGLYGAKRAENTENMQVYSYANNTELLFPSLSFICMSYSTPPLARRKVILIIKLFHCSKCYKRSHNHSFLKLQTVNLVKYVL